MISLKRVTASVTCAMLALSVCVGSASALADINVDEQQQQGIRLVSNDIPESEQMPENPHAQLPEKIAETIPDDATVVSEDLAVTEDGQVQDIETGQKVNDPKLVGTKDKPADPLAKTNGQQFIPVEAVDVKSAVKENNNTTGTNSNTVKNAPETSSQQSQSQDSTVKQSADIAPTKVIPAALTNNSYGAYWGSYNGSPAFFEAGGKLFAQQAKGIIDVSAWQGNIDWNRARSSGVEGAIVRLGYGWDNDIDAYAKRNISELKRLNMPFGVYSYSYAYDVNTARAEGYDMVRLLREAGIAPGDLSYPVYYDLEKWTWKGHHVPTDPNLYEQMVNAWVSVVQGAGYKNAHVYSYTSYLNSSLNRASIHQRTSWVASYGSRTGFSYSTNARGWQYSSQGRVAGIAGAVDVNAFGVADASQGAEFGYRGVINVGSLPFADIPSGVYYINSALSFAMSVDMRHGYTANGTRTQLYRANGTPAQQFRFNKQSDGSYEIVNVKSGRALDVAHGSAFNSAIVQIHDRNGTRAQRWYVRDMGSGYYLQSALGNWVLDVSGGVAQSGADIRLYMPTSGENQRFILSSGDVNIPLDTNTRIKSVKDRNMFFDLRGGKPDDKVQMQIHTWNATDAQLYRFTQVGNSVYTISNVKTNKLVEITGGNMNTRGAIGQYHDNGTPAQRWMARKIGNGVVFFNAKNNLVIDITQGKTYSGNALQSYGSNNTVAQQWIIDRWKTGQERILELASTHRNDIADGVYEVRSALPSTLALDIAHGSKKNGANVQIWRHNNTSAQRWKVSHNHQGFVEITGVLSDKSLSVQTKDQAIGARIHMWDSNKDTSQRWIVIRQSDGSFEIRSALQERYALDVKSAVDIPGTSVRMWNPNNTPAQRWWFIRK